MRVGLLALAEPGVLAGRVAGRTAELERLAVEAGADRDVVALHADDRLDPGRAALLPEVVGPEDVAVVGHRQRRHLLAGRLGEQLLQPSRTVEHRVLGVHVQVHERVAHGRSSPSCRRRDGRAAKIGAAATGGSRSASRRDDSNPARRSTADGTRPAFSSASRLRPARSERRELLVGEDDPGRGDVLLEVVDRLRTRDGQHDRRAAQQPGERELGRGVPGLARPAASSVPPGRGQLAGRDREPRDERRALRARSSRGRPRTGGRPRCRGSAPTRSSATSLACLELVDRDLGQADVPDLALVLQVLEGADLVRERDPVVDPVQLVEVDRSPGRAGAGSARTPGVRYSGRPTGSHSCASGLVCRPALVAMVTPVVRVQRLADQLLGDGRAVGVGRVDEVDARARPHAGARAIAPSGRPGRPRCPAR